MKKKFYPESKQKGFTLIELLLYVSIAAILLLSISAFFQLILSSRTKNATVAEVEQQASQILQIITQTVRNASAVNSPGIASSSTSLSVNVASTPLNPTVFDISSGIIRIKEGANPPVNLNSPRVTASSLTFLNASQTGTPSTVKIQFTLSYSNSPTSEYKYSETFYGSAGLKE